MISRNSGGGFLAAHWEWLAAAAGLAALAGGAAMFALSGGEAPEERAAAVVSHLMAGKRAETGVKPVDMTPYDHAFQLVAKPRTLADVPEDRGSFLASATRVRCQACGRPIPEGSAKCTFAECAKVQPEAQAEADKDGDGMPDAWEKKHGLDTAANDADADKDGDGFTNAEEFAANTNPADAESHPDYFDSLKLVLPLKETFMPFYLAQVQELPGGRRRYYFRDPKARGDSGQRGRMYMPLEGEEVGNEKDAKPTGFVVKGCRTVTVTNKLAAVKGDRQLVTKAEVTIATVVRKSDGKVFELRSDRRKTPLDVQATIAFSRGEPKESVVIPGSVVKIYGKDYEIKEIRSVAKGAEVSIKDPDGKIRVLKALEQ